MDFELTHQGVGSHIEEFLEQKLTVIDKNNLIIYWVTFTVTFTIESDGELDPIFKIFKKFNKDDSGKSPLRIICRHPESNKQGTTITKEALEQLQKLGIEVKGLKDKGNLLPDEADTDGDEDDDNVNGKENIHIPYGNLHAKFIVSSINDQPDTLLLGSFNLSKNSLRKSCESFAKTENKKAVKKAFHQAENMWERADPVTPDQCERLTKLPIVSVKGVQDISSTKKLHWNHKKPFGPLLQFLDEELKNYPSKGTDFQSMVFENIWQRKRKLEIVYLPVGCGKTYIALRWLLQRLSDAWDPKNPKKAWYIAPNQWIQLTVHKVLNSLMNKANINDAERDIIEKHLLIGRASTYSKLTDIPVAAVIDEVHNWSPNNADSYGSATYTGVVNKLRQEGVWMLGMSATPCRIEAERFDRAFFVKAWIGEKNYREKKDEQPLCRFEDAVNEKFICDLEWKTIANNKQQEIIEVLKTGTVKMGDYAGVVLGEVWGVLTDVPKDVNNLVEEIIKQITAHQSRRAVIFLPPVAERLDKFIKIFQDKLQSKTNGKSFDFRSNSGQPSTTIFQDFAGRGASVKSPYVLLTIDRFSEGVSVNDIDLLVMLRPTLSPRVVVQQVGRGVRLFPGKKKCIILDAVNFKNRWDEWNDLPVASSCFEKEALNIDIEALGNMTVAAARDGNRAEDISRVTGVAQRVVQKRLDQGGGTHVRNAFDEWPVDEESVDAPDEIDIDALGDMTVAAARDENRAEDISKVTGNAQRVVQRRLNQGGGVRVKNAFDDWPVDEESVDAPDEIDIDALGDMTVAAARDENRAEDISQVTGVAQRVVQRRLDQGGGAHVRNAFDEWPVDAY